MKPFTVAIALYEGMTTLDAIGPMEVLRFLPGARLEFVSASVGPVLTDTRILSLNATAAFDDVTTPDVVVVPGGPGTAAALGGPVVPWLQQVHPHTRWTTSVCSGSLILGAAGLLTGIRATSHFAVVERLAGFGARPCTDRVVVEQSQRIITAAGVSAGIDMALSLAELLSDPVTAQAIQLVTEYNPNPPYASGSLESAAPEVVQKAIEIGRPHGAIPEWWEAPMNATR